MARIDTLANFVTDIATAIKAKTGKTDPITPANFDTEIASISGGGGGGGSPSILPDGYTELLYIKSTGTQYIRTDLIVTEKTNFSATFRTYDGFTSSSFGCIFGTRYTYNANGYQLTTYPGNSSPYTGHFLFNGTRYSAGLIRDNFKQTASFKDGIFYRPDGGTIDLTSVKTTPPSPMFIFAMCDTSAGDTVAYDFGKVALYSLSFEENGELVANYVPAKRDEDKVVGLYDTVSNKFYTNNGTGEFDYDELKYIEIGGNGNNDDNEPTIPSSMDDVLNMYDINNNNIVKSLIATTNINEPYVAEPVTLYSPSEAHKYYFIRNNGSGYQLIWCDCIAAQSYSGNTGIMPMYVRLDPVKIKTDKYESISDGYPDLSTNEGTPYRTTNTYSTIEECIAAVQDPNVAYTVGAANTYYSHNAISDTSLTPCSNMVCFDSNNKILPSARISNDEAIKVAQTM